MSSDFAEQRDYWLCCVFLCPILSICLQIHSAVKTQSVNDSRRASRSSRECVCGPQSFTEHKDKAGQTACLAAMYTWIHPAVNQLWCLKEQANASLQSTSVLTGFWPSKHPCMGSKYLSCYYLLQLRVQDLIWYKDDPPFLPHYKWCKQKEARYKQYFCVVCNEFLVNVTEHHHS